MAGGKFEESPQCPPRCPPPLRTRKVMGAGGAADRCHDTDRLPGKTNRGSDGNQLLLVSARSRRDRLAGEIRWRAETKGEAMGRGGKGW